MSERRLTGRHVLAIAVGAFGIIIGVNLVMAWQAISTFPGLLLTTTVLAIYFLGDGLRDVLDPRLRV